MWNMYNDYIWDYLYCRSLVMPSGSLGGSEDLLWESLWDVDETVCCFVSVEVGENHEHVTRLSDLPSKKLENCQVRSWHLHSSDSMV